MKQNTPTPMKSLRGWTTLQIKIAMLKASVTPGSIGRANGMTPQAISLAVHGRRKGLAARRAIAQSLGREVTEIWPDALLPVRERRLRAAS